MRVILMHNAAINLLPMRAGELSFPWLASRELGMPVARIEAKLGQLVLDKKSSAALQANDIRTSEGISGYLALATGREDPAVEEYRKQHATLMQLLAEQRAQRTANAEILGAGAA